MKHFRQAAALTMAACTDCLEAPENVDGADALPHGVRSPVAALP